MEKKKGFAGAGCSTILWGVLMLFLCAAPIARAHVTVPAGEEWDIDYDVGGFLFVYGTANVYDGTHAAFGIEAHEGSKVNIHGGTIGTGFAVTVLPGSPPASVTVYGTDFEVSSGTIIDGHWTPDSSGILTGKYADETLINLLFYSNVPITLAPPGTTNLPPVAIAGQEGLIGPGGKIHPIYSYQQESTLVLGQASDPEGQPIQYRWLEGTNVLLDWTTVTNPPEAYLDLSTLPPFELGDHTLTLEVWESADEMLEASDQMTLRILPPEHVEIDIKPGSYPNPINPGSNGLIPVAIFTTETFDAATVDPDSVTVAGAEVAVRGKSEKLMAHLEDVDGDGDIDLLLQVDTQSDGELWETGPVTLVGKTYDGTAIEGTDDVVIVPPE